MELMRVGRGARWMMDGGRESSSEAVVDLVWPGMILPLSIRHAKTLGGYAPCT